MLKKLALLIMSTFLLSQLLPYAYAKAISSEESDELNPRMTMLAAIIHELTTLSTLALKESVPIYKNVLTDLETKSEKSEELQVYMKNIKDFIAIVEKHEKLDEFNDDLMNAYFLFIELTSKFIPCNCGNKKQPMSADATLVKELLGKNGIEQLEKDLKKHFDKFAKTITESIEIYTNTLNDEEKAKDSKFLEWFKKFKDTDDADAKMVSLIESFTFFKDESSAAA